MIRNRRRALLDAIYAIHLGGGQIRIDLTLAQDLERAWEEYDDAVRGALQVENARLYLAARAVVKWKGSPDTPWHAALTRLEAVLDGLDGAGGGNGATS